MVLNNISWLKADDESDSGCAFSCMWRRRGGFWCPELLKCLVWSSWEFISYEQNAVVIDEQAEKKKEIHTSDTFELN